MRLLKHHILCPFSRQVRLALGEKRLSFVLEEANPYLLGDGALGLAWEIPILCEPGGLEVSGVRVILEYLDEFEPDPPLWGRSLREKAEARKIAAWFDTRFYSVATHPIIYEKVDKRLFNLGSPDSRHLRNSLVLLLDYLRYPCYLAEHRNFLAGANFSLADIAAAAHISSLDYLGEIKWEQFPHLKDWYAKIKSRPCFRQILLDRLPGSIPAPHYADLDF